MLMLPSLLAAVTYAAIKVVGYAAFEHAAFRVSAKSRRSSLA
jgi:hypothetical protein